MNSIQLALVNPVSLFAQVPPTAAGQGDSEFIAVTLALGKLVLASMIVERIFAVLFEWEWIRWALSKKTDVALSTSPGTLAAAESKNRESWIPGLKAFIVMISSVVVCFMLQIDPVAVALQSNQSPILTTIMSGLVIAGGSSGAIALFQGHLKLGKDVREARIAETKANLETAKLNAEIATAEAKLNKIRLEGKLAENELAQSETLDAAGEIKQSPRRLAQREVILEQFRQNSIAPLPPSLLADTLRLRR